jgi:hypothetical protein
MSNQPQKRQRKQGPKVVDSNNVAEPAISAHKRSGDQQTGSVQGQPLVAATSLTSTATSAIASASTAASTTPSTPSGGRIPINLNDELDSEQRRKFFTTFLLHFSHLTCAAAKRLRTRSPTPETSTGNSNTRKDPAIEDLSTSEEEEVEEKVVVKRTKDIDEFCGKAQLMVGKNGKKVMKRECKLCS